MGQIVRALEHLGPQPVEELRRAVGATYWEKDRFDRALALAAAEGLVHTRTDGALVASG
jgi:hypothetical protein